jgi:hypothetical protein
MHNDFQPTSKIQSDPEGRTAKFDQLLTLKDVSAALNVPLFAIRRAAKSGAFPVYRIGNARARVRLNEVVRAIEASRTGGAHV